MAIRHGTHPFLECSSKGDTRFSAFYACIKKRDGKSIETLYQASKRFSDGKTNLSWREAKGKKPLNSKYCARFYRRLWQEYLDENPDLIAVLLEAKGLSDIFGQVGHVCQATELWNLRDKYLNN